METYTLLRSFADSWHLVFMVLTFVGIVIWAFRPGAKRTHDEVANSIFRNEDKPARDSAERSTQN